MELGLDRLKTLFSRVGDALKKDSGKKGSKSRGAGPAQGAKESASEPLYHVIFTGEIVKDRNVFQKGLVKLYGQEPERLKRFFSGKPVLLARDARPKKAQKYQNVMKKIGGVCVLKPAGQGGTTFPSLSAGPLKVTTSTQTPLQLRFQGGVLGLFGYSLLAWLCFSFFFLIPVGLHVWFSWVAENSRLSDGSPVHYKGSLGEAYFGFLKFVGLVAVLLLVQVILSMAMSPVLQGMGAGSGFSPVSVLMLLAFVGVLVVGDFLATAYIYYRVTAWLARAHEVNGSGALEFQGLFKNYLKWLALYFLPFVALVIVINVLQFLGAASGGGLASMLLPLVTVVGFAAVAFLYPPWWIANFTSWLVGCVRSARGWRLSWDTTVTDAYKTLIPAMLASLLIIPIPWMLHRVLRWFIENVQVLRA